MKKGVIIVAALLCTIAGLAQREINDPNAEVRNVSGFHAIKVATGIELILTQGSSEAVAVSASSPEFKQYLKTVVENGVLRIYYDRNTFWKEARHKRLKAYVSVVNIDRLEATSGSLVTVEGSLKSDKLLIAARSGAMVNGAVSASDLNIDQSSGSVMSLSGSAAHVSVGGSSGSVFRGYELIADHCEAGTHSGAGVQITVNKDMKARASSGGHISFKGEGVISDIHTSSGGSISKK